MLHDRVLLGVGRHVIPAPGHLVHAESARKAQKGPSRLAFMTLGHHRLRDFVVQELPRQARPLAPDLIARELALPRSEVISLLDDLERHLTFLFRDRSGAVTWAYPVTVEQTPHRVVFSSGETLYAAWAIDAMASPFVQGQLRGEPLSIRVETSCGHCGQLLHLEIDSELRYQVREPEAEPLIFVPSVDFERLEDPSIIDAFWRQSLFFWSEEHARDHRKKVGGGRGVYLTLEQAATITPATQGALFAFPRPL